jgi:hypothetical protein
MVTQDEQPFDGQATPTEEVEAPVAPSASLRIAIGDVDAPRLELSVLDDAFPAGYWVEAKEPKSESVVRRGVNPVRLEQTPTNRAQRRHGGQADDASGQRASAELDLDVWFVNKCREQITAFHLPGVDKAGNAVDIEFDARDKSANETLYRRWSKPRNLRFRVLLEDYLDWVAGRDIEGLAEEFEVLGNA